MLSAVLRSDTAVKVSIQIMQAFVAMRKFIATKAEVFQRLARVEGKQLETDNKFEQLFDAIESKEIRPKQGIFFDGQVFDAYSFVAGLIRSAGTSIVLIGNYIDDTVLTLFAKRRKGVLLTIVTKIVAKRLKLDIKKLNEQYPPVTAMELGNSHDRFLIIDDSQIYHFGASLKDLGKKWFAFSKMDLGAVEMLGKLEKLPKVKIDG
jgi:hypothetical protein